jgi:tRNA pseudouridine55 synthase
MNSSAEQKSGFLLVNKPEGITSHDVVDRLRTITGIKKIGHAGTLDPFATGLLILAIGRESTKKINNFVKKDKQYIADIQLGAKTDTYDKNGKLTYVQFKKDLGESKIKRVLFNFVGEIEQIPPMYSAKKIKGVKLYEMAREGIEITRQPIKIKIYDIDLLSYESQTLRIDVKCSAGAYIRSLANDIGEKLGCGGYLKGLERVAIGDFLLEEAVDLRDLNKTNWDKYLRDLNK